MQDSIQASETSASTATSFCEYCESIASKYQQQFVDGADDDPFEKAGRRRFVTLGTLEDLKT
jgi:hypothetical protein